MRSLTGFEPAHVDKESVELGEEDRSITGPNLADDHRG